MNTWDEDKLEEIAETEYKFDLDREREVEESPTGDDFLQILLHKKYGPLQNIYQDYDLDAEGLEDPYNNPDAALKVIEWMETRLRQLSQDAYAAESTLGLANRQIEEARELFGMVRMQGEELDRRIEEKLRKLDKEEHP